MERAHLPGGQERRGFRLARFKNPSDHPGEVQTLKDQAGWTVRILAGEDLPEQRSLLFAQMGSPDRYL